MAYTIKSDPGKPPIYNQATNSNSNETNDIQKNKVAPSSKHIRCDAITAQFFLGGIIAFAFIGVGLWRVGRHVHIMLFSDDTLPDAYSSSNKTAIQDAQVKAENNIPTKGDGYVNGTDSLVFTRPISKRFEVVAEKSECGGSEIMTGKFASISECASSCENTASMFIFGTNDFGNPKCDYVINGARLCACFCETSATDSGTCTIITQTGYRLYKFVSSECGGWEFQCSNGKCIRLGSKCDNDDHCGDNSDEQNCECKDTPSWVNGHGRDCNWYRVNQHLCDYKPSVFNNPDLNCCACGKVVQTWKSGRARTGNGMGGTSLSNLPFTLYLMQKTKGFSNDAEGLEHYINLCKRNGLLPIGCGTDSRNCDKNRFNDEPCLPMPKSWDCNMMTEIKENTGWGSNMVAILADNNYSEETHTFLYKPGAYPKGNENLQAVCGKISGD